MARRRPRAVLLGAAFGTLTLIGFGVVATYVLFPDPLPFFEQHWRTLERDRGQEEVQGQLARRFHWRGDKEPCLRYPSTLSSEEQQLWLAHQLVSAGHAPMAEHLFELVRQWERHHQASHHLLAAKEERLIALEGHLRGLDRLILRLNRARLLRALRDRERREAPRSASWSRISPKERARFFALWRRNKEHLAGALQMSMEIAEGDSLTSERMERVVSALKRWVAVYGVPPRTLEAFPSELRDDGFGSPFFYEQSARSVWLISTGGDGLWGTSDDRIWGLHR